MIETPTVTTLLALNNYCDDSGDAAGKARGMAGYPRGAYVGGGGGGGSGSDDAGSGYNSSSSGGNSIGKHGGGGSGSKKARGGGRHRRPHDRRGDREPQ
jgi:hypothetical protein